MSTVPYALCTRDEVKAYLVITTADFDGLFDLLINASTDWIERECGNRRLVDLGEDQIEVYDGDPQRIGRNKIFLTKYPVNSINQTQAQGIEFNDGGQFSQDWVKQDIDDFNIDLKSGIVHSKIALPPKKYAVRITYQGGFLTEEIPNDLKLACIKIAAKEFDKKLSQGVVQESVGGGTVNWNENVDPEVMQIIRKYRRFGHESI